MPRFFFNRIDGCVDQDDSGTDFSDLNAARVAAVVFAGESLRDNPAYVWDGKDFRVEVRDENGRLVMTVVTSAIDAAGVAMVPSAGTTPA